MPMPNPHALSEAQLAELRSEGFLVLGGILPQDTVDALVGRFAAVVDEYANHWLSHGLIDGLHEELDFAHRWAHLRRLVPATEVQSWRTVLVSRELHALWQEPHVLGAIRSILGDEVAAHGIWNGRPREPGSWDVQRVTWHQDAAYYEEWDPGDGTLVTCWSPLLPVDEESGCLQLARRSNHEGYIPFVRAANGVRSVPAGVLDAYEVVSAVMEPGDVLLFLPTVLHQALDNRSDHTRWSVDIRFGQATPEILRKLGPGYVCHSADPSRVEDFATWSARYDLEREAEGRTAALGRY